MYDLMDTCCQISIVIQKCLPAFLPVVGNASERRALDDLDAWMHSCVGLISAVAVVVVMMMVLPFE